MGTPVLPDFLRQVFNVVLAEQNVDERTTSEARKMVWEAENKYKFSSFDIEDERTVKENLKKYFESDDFVQLLKLLRNKGNTLQALIERVERYYGKELADIIRKRVKEVEEE